MFNKRIFPYALLLFIFTACEDDGVFNHFSKTVIIYIAADNDLCENAEENIQKMQDGLDSDIKNLIVYLDTGKEMPSLIKIQKKENITVRIYQEQNSATCSVLKNVLQDVIQLYPSDSYSLILWSHGTSWIPEGVHLRSFGYENGSEIDIKDLAENLPGKFDYIIFDACLMGGVEVAWSLREKADYILFSPTEIVETGFPYDRITSLLHSKNESELIKIAEEYHRYYSEMEGDWQSASISVIKTEEMEQLASLTHNLISRYPLEKWDYSQSNVQQLDLFTNHISYDFLDFLEKNYPPQSVSPVKELLEHLILYKACTDMFLGQYAILNFCGLSCYIPDPRNEFLNAYYRTLPWCQESGFYMLFD